MENGIPLCALTQMYTDRLTAVLLIALHDILDNYLTLQINNENLNTRKKNFTIHPPYMRLHFIQKVFA